ncbi:MAG: nucleotide exchange factor GrpE [Thermodesulfobacteriota bacterium]
MVSENEHKDEAAPMAEAEAPPAAETGEAAPDLAAQLEQAQARNRELEERVLRMAADLDNFKKRMQRERETALKYAEESILRELLPSVDNLERAIAQGKTTPDVAPLLAGVEMTCQMLSSTLEKFGLKPLDGVGQPFDPNFHEALAMEHSDTVEANHILQEYQKGYMFKDRLIRAAKVVVSQGKAAEA